LQPSRFFAVVARPNSVLGRQERNKPIQALMSRAKDAKDITRKQKTNRISEISMIPHARANLQRSKVGGDERSEYQITNFSLSSLSRDTTNTKVGIIFDQ
jgi:hypothetical protein